MDEIISEEDIIGWNDTPSESLIYDQEGGGDVRGWRTANDRHGTRMATNLGNDARGSGVGAIGRRCAERA